MVREVCSCSILGQCRWDFGSLQNLQRIFFVGKVLIDAIIQLHAAAKPQLWRYLRMTPTSYNIPQLWSTLELKNIGRLENRKNLASRAFAVAEIVKSRGWLFFSKCLALLQVCTWDLSLSLFAAFFSASQIQLQAYSFYPKLTTNKLSPKQQVQMLNAVALRKLLLSDFTQLSQLSSSIAVLYLRISESRN